MQAQPMAPELGAELQRKLVDLVEGFRSIHGVSPGAVFQVVLVFAWRYAHARGETPDSILNRVLHDFKACELAHDKRVREALGGGNA